MREDPANLAVLALGQAHFDPAIAAGAALEIGVDRAIVHAFDRDPLGQRFELVLGDVAESAGAVGAHDAGSRELELALQLAVVGHQQQAFGHEIEAADRHHSRHARRKPVVDGRTAPWVALGGDRPLGL